MDEKVLKIRRRNDDDRISELPDPILGKIVSFLPTKHAVAAAVLSTRWKNIFPFELRHINIDLNDSLRLHPTEPYFDVSTSFIDFVDKLLDETLHDVSCVDTFTLICDYPCDEAKCISWIRTAVRLKVRELRLDFILEKDTTNLFNTIIGCTTLTKLELKYAWGYRLYIGVNFSLPTLRTLELFNVVFAEDEKYNFETLIDGCPVLEELLLSCEFDDILDLDIVSPVLKTLNTRSSNAVDLHVTINTPNLELLSLNNHGDGYSYSIYPFNSLRLGHIDVESWFYYDSVKDLVYDCRQTRNLHLALSSIQHPRYANKQLPEFQNLTSLSISCVGSNGWVALACILNNAPNLEQLTFEKKFERSDMGFSDFEQLVPSPPTCLVHLKEVEFRHFDMNEDELKLLNYFLHNGKVLEKVVRNIVLVPIKRCQGP